MAKTRPNNKELTKLLWDFIRSEYGNTVPEYIMLWTKDNYLETFFNKADEIKSYKLSKATAGPNNPSFKGTIYAVNIKTDEVMIINSRLEMVQLGFLPSGVYNCLTGISYTHKGHVFLREVDMKKPRKLKRIPK